MRMIIILMLLIMWNYFRRRKLKNKLNYAIGLITDNEEFCADKDIECIGCCEICVENYINKHYKEARGSYHG